MLVREAVERFQRGLIGQGASANTVTTYMRHLDVFMRSFDGKAVTEITAADVNEFLFQARLKADGSEMSTPVENRVNTLVALMNMP